MIERDLHNAESSLARALGALHAAGPFAAILLVVLAHALAFAIYFGHAAYASEMGPPLATAGIWAAVAVVARKVLLVAGATRKAVRWASAAMALLILANLESATGIVGRMSEASTGVNADVALFRATGIALGPQASAEASEANEAGTCREWRDDGTLHNGLEWSVARTEGCMRYLSPADGERSCKAFAATKARFEYQLHRDFCSTWVKGAELQPWDGPRPAR